VKTQPSRQVLPPRVSHSFGPIGRALGLLATLLVTGCFVILFADPGAVPFALGGLEFRKEPRISMLRENLTIADETPDTDGSSLLFTVSVDYDFLNNTHQDVTISMAFPVPDDYCLLAVSPYPGFVGDRSSPSSPFRVWGEGQEIAYSTEVRAFRSNKDYPTFSSNLGKDYTGLLRKLGVDPASCLANAGMPQSAKLNLVALGLLDEETHAASWTVRRKYYWTQIFPANKTTHIKIAYPAQHGSTEIYLGKGWDKHTVQATEPLWRQELHDTCGGPGLQRKIAAELSQPERFVQLDWVDFILVTANYWNGPIKDFVLTVKTLDRGQFPGTRVSFCWDGPISRPDAAHLVATAHDFSPNRNLHIGFFKVF
jgi:hypothetical protein